MGRVQKAQYICLCAFRVFAARQRRRCNIGCGTKRLNIHQFDAFILKRFVLARLWVYGVYFFKRPLQALRL